MGKWFTRILPACAAACLLWPTAALAGELAGTEIAARAFAVNEGRDGAQRLTYTIKVRDRPDTVLRFAMLWKRYPVGGRFQTKVLMFPEFPPSMKGVAYLGHITWMGGGRADDEWIYLPDLRAVRRLSHKRHSHHDSGDDPFIHSELKHGDLTPRPPELDWHTLIGTDTIGGIGHYVLESTPKVADPRFPYARTVRWITRDGFLPVRVDFHSGPSAVKQVEITWRRVGAGWGWEKVTAFNRVTGNETVLSVEHAWVDRDLPESTFGERAMRAGPGRYFK